MEFKLNEDESVGGKTTLIGILSFAGGAALTVGVELLIIGGVSSSGSLVFAASMSMAAYTIMTAGVALIIAGVVTGGYLIVKSNWNYDEAN
jgi:hypothetical protein